MSTEAACVQLARCALPRVGLGTFRSRGEECRAAVLAALQCGIRHIDTASIYKNEHEVGKAVSEAIAGGIPRSAIFLTSKISPYEQGSKARPAFEASLQALGVDYMDMMLIHWPGVSKMAGDDDRIRDLRLESWRVLEDMHALGRVRAIGVSNFEVRHLRHLLQHCRVRPAVNQVEVHPQYPQEALRQFCDDEGIQVVAYASLGCGNLCDDEAVKLAAERNGITPAQALLVWALQRRLCVIPKSVNAARISQFAPAALLSPAMMGSDLKELDGLATRGKYCWDPTTVTV